MSCITDEEVSAALKGAQEKARLLFVEVETRDLLRPGIFESDLSREVYEVAKSMFGISKYWHKRIVRSGSNTLCSNEENPPNRRLEEDDIAFIDLGPVFDEWEADFGHAFVLGNDRRKHQLVADLTRVFDEVKQEFLTNEKITGAELYACAQAAAEKYGWRFGAKNAGHLIGAFPHVHATPSLPRNQISPHNHVALRERDEQGRMRHWVLEIKLVEPDQQYAGFYEDILTL